MSGLSLGLSVAPSPLVFVSSAASVSSAAVCPGAAATADSDSAPAVALFHWQTSDDAPSRDDDAGESPVEPDGDAGGCQPSALWPTPAGGRHKTGEGDDRPSGSRGADQEQAGEPETPIASDQPAVGSASAVRRACTPRITLGALDRDAAHSICAFLARGDFVRLARASRHFRQAAIRMPACRWEIDWTHLQSVDLSPLLASPLRHHVTTLRLLRDLYTRSWTPSLAHDDLCQIADRLPQLEVLECEVALPMEMPPLRWPAKLRVLDLRLTIHTGEEQPPLTEQQHGNDSQSVSTLMRRVGESLLHCAPAVEEFKIDCLNHEGRSRPIPGDLLSPLAEWPLLGKLTLRGPLSPSNCSSVRRLPHLTFLHVQDMKQFVVLLPPDGPMLPHLEDVQFHFGRLWLSAEVAPLLLKLTSLRRLQAYWSLADPTSLVPILRRLTSLDVEIHPPASYHLDRFVSALQQCTQLTELHLTDSDDMTGARLTSLLAPMRRLQTLVVVSCGLTSFDFLADAKVAHLAETLRQLRIESAPLEPTVDPLPHLRRLRSLEKLVLYQCFPKEFPLAAATIGALTPGGAGFQRETSWPRLHTFEWTPIA